MEKLVNGDEKKKEMPKKEKEGNLKLNEKACKAKDRNRTCC